MGTVRRHVVCRPAERRGQLVAHVHRPRCAAALLPLRPAVPPLAVLVGKSAEFISDSDFDLISNGDALAQDYDLVVFEGHEEYVTTHEYDVVQRYRDLGGNLMFLSANNFFWKVKEEGGSCGRSGSGVWPAGRRRG